MGCCGGKKRSGGRGNKKPPASPPKQEQVGMGSVSVNSTLSTKASQEVEKSVEEDLKKDDPTEGEAIATLITKKKERPMARGSFGDPRL